MADVASTSKSNEESSENDLNESLSGETRKSMATRIGLNDNKAGMGGLDKDKINKIIYENSKGSKFYENELKKDKVVQEKIKSLKSRLSDASGSELKECLNKADTLLTTLYNQYDFTRYIAHMDMDAFYAAVEIRDNPKLRDVPMAVGGEDMLSTSNYAARRYGVRAAMPGFIARKLCPHLVLVPVNMRKYAAVSKIVKLVLVQYDPDMNPMSLDEAYLDFTDHMSIRGEFTKESRTLPEYSEDMCRCEPDSLKTRLGLTEQSAADNRTDDKSLDPPTAAKLSACDNSTSKDTTQGVVCPHCNLPINPKVVTFGLTIEEAVNEMRHRIHLRTKLTASAGIAANSLLAKICSDKNKPNGQYLLPFDVKHVQEFMKDLPIRKVPGIGKVSEKQLQAFDIATCGDFYRHRDVICFLYSGGSFEYFMSIYMGLGSNRICRNEEGPKSKSVERTFRNMSDTNELLNMCYDLSMDLSEDLKSADNLMGKTVTLKIKLATFEGKTRAQSLPSVTNDGEEIYKVANSLLRTEIKGAQPKPLVLRLMGVRMSNFSTADSKQTKLKVSKVDTKSFFDTIAGEKKRSSAGKEKSLGLLAYMADYKPSPAKPDTYDSLQKCPSNSLNRFLEKRKSTWDETSGGLFKKAAKSVDCETVSVCSLVDSDSTIDSLEDKDQPYPLSSTPHGAKAKTTKSSGKHANRTVNNSGGASKSKRKTVESYFTKTRSVWDDFNQSSDEDIVCLSNDKPTGGKGDTKTTKTRGRKATSKFSADTAQSTLAFNRTRKRPIGKNKKSPAVLCDVIVLDSD